MKRAATKGENLVELVELCTCLCCACRGRTNQSLQTLQHRGAATAAQSGETILRHLCNTENTVAENRGRFSTEGSLHNCNQLPAEAAILLKSCPAKLNVATVIMKTTQAWLGIKPAAVQSVRQKTADLLFCFYGSLRLFVTVFIVIDLFSERGHFNQK